MGEAQVVDYIEALVKARLRNDRAQVLGLVDALLRGPKWDAYAVTAVLAGSVAEGMPLPPGETFHRVRVAKVCPNGCCREDGDANDLPPHARLFAQMVAALANEDRQLARDLFIGYVGEHAIRAQAVILFGLNELARAGLRDALRGLLGGGPHG